MNVRPPAVAGLLATFVVCAPAKVTADETSAAAAPPSRVLAGSVPAQPTVYISAEPGAFGPRDRSPGLALALSLTPVPVDFGNLYAENVAWGLAYTGGELLLAGGMIWLGADHMCHHPGSCSAWSASETVGMSEMVVGYVAIKILSGLHAAHAATDFDAKRRVAAWAPVVAPLQSGASMSLAGWF